MIEAVIPTIGASPLLFELLATLEGDGISTTVYDNGCDRPTREALAQEPVRVVDATGMSLYEMWDRAVHRSGARYMAILNDDIRIHPGTLDRLVIALESHPEVDLISPDYNRPFDEGIAMYLKCDTEVRGTYSSGGPCGWCFAVRVWQYPDVGSGYRWWCGDDELVARIQARGRKVAVLRGVPVLHLNEASASSQPWTHEAKSEDLATFRRRWG